MIGLFLSWLAARTGLPERLLAGLAAALAAALAFAAIALHFQSLGRQQALDAVRRANDKARERADAAQRSVEDCPAGRWSRTLHRCEAGP